MVAGKREEKQRLRSFLGIIFRLPRLWRVREGEILDSSTCTRRFL